MRIHLWDASISAIRGRRRWAYRALLLTFLALMWLPGPTAAASEEDTVWLDSTGRPNVNARDALRLLADAAADGLATRDYQATDLAERAARLDAAPSTATSQQPAFERSLDSAMHR